MSHAIAAVAPNPANAPSHRFFGGIGIPSGARVLDVGCGQGDLSRFLARLVGPSGQVVGIDRSEQALAQAGDFAPLTDAAPIEYRPVDLSRDVPDLGSFDAIVGRRVLMYLPDAAGTLAGLIALAKPEAVVAFQEHARAALPVGLGSLTLHRQLYDWNWSTVAAEGGDVSLGLRLADLLSALGLSIQEARSEAILLQSGEPSFVPTLAQAMLPRMVERGIANEEDVDLPTLARRLDLERAEAGGTVVWDLAFLVAARTHDAD